MDWLKMMSRAHERDRVFYEKIAFRAINDHLEGLYPGYKPKGDRKMNKETVHNVEIWPGNIKSLNRGLYYEIGPNIAEADILYDFHPKFDGSFTLVCLKSPAYTVLAAYVPVIQALIDRHGPAKSEPIPPADIEKVTDKVYKNEADKSTRRFLNTMQPISEIEVVCFHDERSKGEVSITTFHKGNIDNSLSTKGKYLRNVAHILLEQADRYEGKGFRVYKSDPNEASTIPDHKFPGLASFREREGLEVLIVEEEPHSFRETAVESKYEFYRSPEDRKEENNFMTVFFCKDGDVIIQDNTTQKPESICIPKRFIMSLIRLIREKQPTPEVAFPVSHNSNLLQQPENKADLEGQKLKALTELTKSALKRPGEVTADRLEDVMEVFRRMVGLPPIKTDLIQTETSDSKDGHT